jgi:hypothetical protein
LNDSSCRIVKILSENSILNILSCMIAAVKIMANCLYRNFDITILGESAPYPVHIAYGDHTAEGRFAHDAELAIWQRFFAALHQPEPGEELLLNAGSALFSELFQTDVRDLWLRARSDLERGTVDGLRLRLAMLPPAVAALPWEFLYDPDRNTLFAAQQRTPVVRIERAYRHLGTARPRKATLPLRLLIAAPEDETAGIDADAEIARLRSALSALPSTSLTIDELRGRVDVLALRRALQERQIDILHVISHGAADGLMLWRDEQAYLAPAGALRATMDQAPSVRLVVLNACHTGRIAGHTPFATLAQQLLQTGVPAVVAMQSEILDEDAITFAYHLYDELATGSHAGAIDAAVAGARSALYARNPGSSAYGTPVLWLNRNDQLFDLPAVAPIPEAPRVSAPGKDVDETSSDSSKDGVGAAAFDAAEVAQWLGASAAQVEAHAAHLPLDRRFLLESWRNGAAELEALLHQWRALAQNPDDDGDLRRQKQERIQAEQSALARLAEKIRLMRSEPPQG